MTGKGVQSGQKMDNKTPTNSHYGDQSPQQQQLNTKGNVAHNSQNMDKKTGKGIPENTNYNDQFPHQQQFNTKTTASQNDQHIDNKTKK
jgi:hypothetical protein